jgi:lipopolysaccharide export system protein LptA
MAETRAPTRLALAALAAFVCLAPLRALAEKADRDKPMQIEANRMSTDDAARISVFEGNVILTQGTIRVLADRIVVHQDPDGFDYATATGNPVHFRQKADPEDGQPPEWITGEADRIEINDRDQKIELFHHAWVTRGQNKVEGDYIFVDERSQYYSVKAGKDGAPGGGRVRAVLQPKVAPAPPAATPAPAKPPAAK